MGDDNLLLVAKTSMTFIKFVCIGTGEAYCISCLLTKSRK